MFYSFMLPIDHLNTTRQPLYSLHKMTFGPINRFAYSQNSLLGFKSILISFVGQQQFESRTNHCFHDRSTFWNENIHITWSSRIWKLSSPKIMTMVQLMKPHFWQPMKSVSSTQHYLSAPYKVLLLVSSELSLLSGKVLTKPIYRLILFLTNYVSQISLPLKSFF